MTDKQINLLKNLDKNKIFNGDTIQFNFIEKTVKGVCFNQSIYIPIEDFEYFLQQLKRKEQECEELKKYLNQIRDEELSHLDIEWDEYETSARQEDYSNIITLVERALGEIDD